MISVAMATCQGEHLVGAQLRSILQQLSEEDQVVVADASSTDRTLEVVRSFGDPRVEIVPGLPRGRIPSTFGAALEQCRGRYVFLSDQDDLWLPGKVLACTGALESTNAMLVVHDAVVVDSRGQVLLDSYFSKTRFAPGFWRNLWRPGYLGCATAFSRALLDKALPIPDDVPMHDWWLGLLAERCGSTVRLDAPLIHHIRHGDNANFQPGHSPYSLARRLAMRATMLRLLADRSKEKP